MDAITLLLYMFFGFVLLMIILLGIAFLKALFGKRPASVNQTSGTMTEDQRAQE